MPLPRTSRLFVWLLLYAASVLPAFCFATAASGEVAIDPAFRRVLQASGVGYLIDDGGSLSYQDILAAPFDANAQEAHAAIQKLNRQRAIWARFTLTYSGDLPVEVQLGSPMVSNVLYFISVNGGLSTTSPSGFFYSPPTSVYYFSPYYIPQHFNPGDTVVYHVRMEHRTRFLQPSDAHFSVLSNPHFEEVNNQAASALKSFTYYNIFFVGLLVFQIVYIAIQWMLVRRIEYLYYILYLLCIFLYFYGRFSLMYSGLPHNMAQPAWMVGDGNDILLVLPAWFYYRFGRYFMDIPTRAPRLNRTVKFLEHFILISILLVLLLNVVVPNDLSKQMVVSVTIVVHFCVTLFVLYKIYQLPQKTSLFLLIGSAIAIISHLLAMFLPIFKPEWFKTFMPGTITMTGLMLEIAIFNSGLLFKARQVEREQVESQRKLIDELRQRQELQEEYSGVRDKIASDLHDDIGSTLSSISIYSYAARNKLGEGALDAAGELMGRIENSAGETMGALADLVWAINPNNDTAEKLIKRIRSFCLPLLAAKDIEAAIDVDEKFYQMPVSQLERRNLLLIFKEVANNIAKHSGATVATFSLHIDASVATIVMRDNGKGFDTRLASEGNGLRTIFKRANELGGEMKLKSGADGTTYSITLPL